MRNVNFLVVDDCATVLALVSKIIQSRLGSNNIRTAGNGEQALEVLKKHDIDIIICDWEMPQLNGIELLKQLRQIKNYKNIPFIMMSSQGGREFVVKAIENGVNHYVVKPFAPEKLENAVNKAFNGANKRLAQRFSGLPKHRLLATNGYAEIEAQVSDISRTGMLIKAKFDPQLNLFSQWTLNVEFEEIDELGFIHLGSIKGKVIRIEADNALEADNPYCEAAFYFPSKTLKPDVVRNMATLLEFMQCKTKDLVVA